MAPPGRNASHSSGKGGGFAPSGRGGGRGGGQTAYQRQMAKGKGKGRSYAQGSQAAVLHSGGRRETAAKAQLRQEVDALDERWGYARYAEGPPRLGWLFNMLPTTRPDATGREKSGLDLYFLEQDGGTFKATVYYNPYMYACVSDDRHVQEAAATLRRKFEEHGMTVTAVDKEDLDLPNHLSGKRRRLLKMEFDSTADLQEVKAELLPIVKANQSRSNVEDVYQHLQQPGGGFGGGFGGSGGSKPLDDPLSALIELREYDVAYTVRCSIDLDVRVGAWYLVTPEEQGASVAWQKDMVEKAEPRTLAFDIECTKAPLKFPSVDVDEIFMISYMADGQGHLIISRSVVSEDIADFEYTPKPRFHGPFTVANEPDERSLIRRFLTHVQELRPQILVTYNGDFFDWPFLEERARKHGMSLRKEIGISPVQAQGGGKKGGGNAGAAAAARQNAARAADRDRERENGGGGGEGEEKSSGGGGSGGGRGMGGAEYRGHCCVHLDAFYWVKRDSYLPQGSQGLKAVTRYKLGYDPVEVDPEDMVRLAAEKPTEMASYSVSDAVATFYLYQTYVHLFVFSLCTIIPMGAEDVLRKGSGTLCEALLMVEAFRGNILCPNKHSDPLTSFVGGQLLESETYIGGHVECLETGVFRSDLPVKFRLAPAALQQLLDNLDRDLRFAVEAEAGKRIEDVTNLAAVRALIAEKLTALLEAPVRDEPPLIYHLDVAAMYPNIILSNRLQPSAIVSNAACAACDFNEEGSDCKRPLQWMWRGDMVPASRAEYEGLEMQLSYESFEGQPYTELAPSEQARLLRERVKDYCRKVYKKTKVTKEESRLDTVCQRENPFYVNTVRAFRDRRYEHKASTKLWKRAKSKAEAAGDAVARKLAEDKELVYDSLQLAHKCILNSFYGYVMRKGARWRSMEMAGIVTYTGAQLIKQARELVEQVGRPLELDTDGIWCILPASFPENFSLELSKEAGGGAVALSYPCAMLNADVHERYTNHQYQELVDPVARRYAKRSECSIFFEVDGPYHCMVLPSSTEEGKLLKKRYAVFNPDNTLAELKGFELKRRGELELIKCFQGQVFEMFLQGSTLEECYHSVASVANHWLDVLESRGADLDDDELMELISENKTISQTLEDYGSQKGTSLTTARRLADFLGSEMVKDKGLNCRLVIASRPHGAPVTERAVPTVIFAAEAGVKKHYLRKWLKDPTMADEDFDFRNIVDWGYYAERLGKSIQKIITIPAAMQKVANPVPRVAHPDWLQKRVREKNEGHRQTHIDELFRKGGNTGGGGSGSGGNGTPARAPIADIEDSGGCGGGSGTPRGPIRARVNRAAGSGSRGVESPPAGGGSGGENGKEAPSISPDGKGAEEDGEGECPSRTEDFQGWLAFQKRRWRQRRQQRKRVRRLHHTGLTKAGGGGGGSGSGGLGDSSRAAAAGGGAGAGNAAKRRRPALGSTGLAGYIRDAHEQLMRSCWQVVEVREGDSAGEVVVWAMVGATELQRITVQTPRTFYVNSRVEPGAGIGRRVAKQLPRQRQSYHLMEVTLSEQRFRAAEREIGGFLRHPAVEGVYGLATPALFDAVVKLGCLTRVGAARRGRVLAGGGAATDGLKVEELESVPALASTVPYLHPSAARFRRTFLYHSESEQGRRAAVALFFVAGLNDDLETAGETAVTAGGGETVAAAGETEVLLWFVEPRGTNSRPPMQKIYEHYAGGENAAAAPCTFAAKSAPTQEAMWALADAALAEHGRRKRGATVVLAQTPLPPPQLRRCLPALRGFPVVPVPASGDDGRYPALAWQNFAAQRAVQRYLRTKDWLRERLAHARYSHIPLANVGADAPVSMADVIFARQLRHNRQILWASPSARPDLGGAEADENDAFCEELTSPLIAVPGAYRSVCIELDIFGLGVDAVANAAQLEALEGATGAAAAAAAVRVGGGGAGGAAALFGGNGAAAAGGEGGGELTGGEDSAVSGAFRVLRVLVAAWLSDAADGSSLQADELLQHFYRWLCARQALLHDPALHRLVHRFMQKVFSRLVAELRRLGARVVFASFSRIILATNKADLAAAQEYVGFVVNTVTSSELFSVLQLRPRCYWKQLLFLDEENYGGIAAYDHGSDAADADFEMSQDNAIDLNNGSGGGGNDGGESMDVEVVEAAAASPAAAAAAAASPAAAAASSGDQFLEEEEEEEPTEEQEQPPDDDPDAVGADAGEAAAAAGEGEGGDSKIKSHWNVAEYLPETARRCFLELVGEFLYRPAQKAEELRRRRDDVVAALSSQLMLSQQQAAGGDGGGGGGGGGGLAGSGGGGWADDGSGAVAVREALRREEESEAETMAEFMRVFVAKVLTRRVLDAAPEVLRRDGTGPDAFPRQAGSWREMSNPALELVKSLCHVLALDSSVAEEVEGLRRQALAGLGVRPFSPEAEFADPCSSFVLPDLICAFCNHCRDVDLCRDPSATAADPADRWRCKACGHQHDLRAVELALVDVATLRTTRYQLQDLRCVSCRAAASSAMALSCRRCSGALAAQDTPQDMRRELLLLRRLALFHGFEWLGETVERMLLADGVALE